MALVACASANKFLIPGAPQFQPMNSRTGLIEALQREAAEVGANAIIFLGYDKMGLVEAAMIDEEAEYRLARGTAIRVVSEG